METMPKMTQEAQSDELRAALSEHLEVAKTQAERIESISKELGTDPKTEKCKGMEGVLKEGSDLLKETAKKSVMPRSLRPANEWNITKWRAVELRGRGF
jgi:ferritin-like metal-binding protein YciE